MSTRDQILQDALKLPPEDREYVADQLNRSLPPGEFDSESLAAAWSHEIDRRIAAYDRGETKGVEFDAALEWMRSSLDAHRAGKSAR